MYVDVSFIKRVDRLEENNILFSVELAKLHTFQTTRFLYYFFFLLSKRNNYFICIFVLKFIVIFCQKKKKNENFVRKSIVTSTITY